MINGKRSIVIGIGTCSPSTWLFPRASLDSSPFFAYQPLSRFALVFSFPFPASLSLSLSCGKSLSVAATLVSYSERCGAQEQLWLLTRAPRLIARLVQVPRRRWGYLPSMRFDERGRERVESREKSKSPFATSPTEREKESPVHVRVYTAQRRKKRNRESHNYHYYCYSLAGCCVFSLLSYRNPSSARHIYGLVLARAWLMNCTCIYIYTFLLALFWSRDEYPRIWVRGPRDSMEQRFKRRGIVNKPGMMARMMMRAFYNVEVYTGLQRLKFIRVYDPYGARARARFC